MGDTANLPPNLLDDHEFLSDLARFSEQLLDKNFIRRKYPFVSSAAWEALGSDEELIQMVQAERLRRVRSGQAKRELAQKHVARAPDILNDLMLDPAVSPRHRVDSIKALDALADPGLERAPDSSERFQITINLGNDLKLKVDKELGMVKTTDGEVLEHDDHDDDTAPLLAAIAAKKDHDDGSRGGASW